MRSRATPAELAEHRCDDAHARDARRKNCEIAGKNARRAYGAQSRRRRARSTSRDARSRPPIRFRTSGRRPRRRWTDRVADRRRGDDGVLGEHLDDGAATGARHRDVRHASGFVERNSIVAMVSSTAIRADARVAPTRETRAARADVSEVAW